MYVKWLCDHLEPINLWNVWRSNMGSGADYMYEEDRMKVMKELQEKAPYSAHYQKRTPEPIEVIESWGLSFHLGNAVKYIARADFKGTKKQDLEKAIWYLQREVAKC